MLDADDRRALEALVRRFAREIEATLFSVEAPDGDPARLPALLARAASLDLLADPTPGASGHDLGVWGSHCLDEGAALSLCTLSLLAEACAGFAAAVHAQGLGCLALASAALESTASLPTGTHLAAAYMPAYGLPLGRRSAGAGSGLLLVEHDDACRLDGTAHFIISAAQPAAIVCFATTRTAPLAACGDLFDPLTAPADLRNPLAADHNPPLPSNPPTWTQVAACDPHGAPRAEPRADRRDPRGAGVVAATARPADAQARTTNEEWAILLLDVAAPGVALAGTGRRTGLRAMHQFHLSCNAVAVPPDRILACGDAARHILARVLACDWLGQAAVALGSARRALTDARAYAAERYQGGDLIAAHPAVQLLLGTAESDITLLEAIVHRHAGEPLSRMAGRDLLVWAAAARLAAGEHAHRAVTHCLQVLGGYGYMEDYPLEKRLRDVATLKSLHGAPDQLRLLLDELKAGQP